MRFTVILYLQSEWMLLYEFDPAAVHSRNICLHLHQIDRDSVANETALATHYHADMHRGYPPPRRWNTMDIELPRIDLVTEDYVQKLNIVVRTLPEWMNATVFWQNGDTDCLPRMENGQSVYHLEDILAHYAAM